MLAVFDTLLPIFVLIGLGAALQRFGFFGEGFVRGLSRLVFWIGIPCLLFDKLSTAKLSWSPIFRILIVFFGATSLALLIGFLVARARGLSRVSSAAFVQACYRGNLGFVGLPVALYAGASLFPQEGAAVGSLAVLALAPIAPIYNLIAVMLMVGSKEKIQWRTIGDVGKGIATNPILIAASLGIAFSICDLRLPVFLQRSVHSLGRITIALALLSMGGIFVQVPMKGALRNAFWSALIKVTVVPLLGLGLALWLSLTPVEAAIAMIFLATPVAVSSFVFVEQFQGDEELAVNAVVLSTIMSIATMPFVLWLLLKLVL